MVIIWDVAKAKHNSNASNDRKSYYDPGKIVSLHDRRSV